MAAVDWTFDASKEELLRPNPNRHVLYPIQFPELWAFYKKALASQWVVEEIDMSQDRGDWNKLSADEQHFIKVILAFFASSDGIVSENIVSNFSQEVTVPEARCFYAIQNAIEVVHAETYAKLLEFFIRDEEERITHIHAHRGIPVVERKAQWAMRYMDPTLPFPVRLAAFSVVEGLFFSGSFCALFWLKSRALLKGLTYSNELIARDEGLHCEFACAQYKMLEQRVPEGMIQAMIREAVECEVDFIRYALPRPLLGMNSDAMSKYIEFIADRVLQQLGYSKIYNSENPFSFMSLSNFDGKTNFFERRVGEYSKLATSTEDWFSSEEASF